MMSCESKNSKTTPHQLTLDNRKLLILTGVAEVDSYDEKSITAYTDLGELCIKGENLNIKKLNLEMGELEVDGLISSLCYKDVSHGGSGFFSKLFK